MAEVLGGIGREGRGILEEEWCEEGGNLGISFDRYVSTHCLLQIIDR